jgi:hypothetical protein
MTVADTLAYYVMATITAVKSFIVQAPRGTSLFRTILCRMRLSKMTQVRMTLSRMTLF